MSNMVSNMVSLVRTFFFVAFSLVCVSSYKRPFPKKPFYLGKDKLGLDKLGNDLDDTYRFSKSKKKQSRGGFYPHHLLEYDLETQADILNTLQTNYEAQACLHYLETHRLYNPVYALATAKKVLDPSSVPVPVPVLNLEAGGLFRDYNVTF